MLAPAGGLLWNLIVIENSLYVPLRGRVSSAASKIVSEASIGKTAAAIMNGSLFGRRGIGLRLFILAEKRLKHILGKVDRRLLVGGLQ
jgi:hypothetical protein